MSPSNITFVIFYLRLCIKILLSHFVVSTLINYFIFIKNPLEFIVIKILSFRSNWLSVSFHLGVTYQIGSFYVISVSGCFHVIKCEIGTGEAHNRSANRSAALWPVPAISWCIFEFGRPMDDRISFCPSLYFYSFTKLWNITGH